MTDPHASIHPTSGSEVYYGTRGLTKREHYAGLALQGLLADSERRSDDKLDGETCVQATARLAVEHADALIEALNR